MARFKKGDRVTIVNDKLAQYGVPKGCHGTVDEDDSDEPWVFWDEGDADRRWCTGGENLSGNKYEDMARDTVEKYHIGDLYTRNGGTECYVSGVCGTNVFFGNVENDEAVTFYSDAEIIEEFKKIEEVTVDEAVELTMDAIADKFGVDVSKLKIKKED